MTAAPLTPVKNGTAKNIVVGCYTLTSTGCIVVGNPDFEAHKGIGDFIDRAHKASSWWLADWLRYGESRADWRERIDQAVELTGLSESTVHNVKSVGVSVPVSRRRENVSFAVHSEVASLDADEQGPWLERAEVEGWTQRELRVNIRASKRARILTGQATLEGMYRIVYADPPWSYADSGPTSDGSLGKAARHYETMSMKQIADLPVQAHTLPNSALFLWVPASMLMENPGPREVVEAWGFTPKTSFVWDKVLGMPGHYSHVVHELLLVCTRGSCLPDIPTPQPKSIQTIRRKGEHSSKPEEFRQLIEKHWPAGPYLELFGRKRIEGWTVLGNDARLWTEVEA